MRNIILVGTLLLVVLSLPFLVKVKTECNPKNDSCPQVPNESLYKAKRDSGKILNQNPKVLDYSLQFKLPNTLLINLITKKPYFAIIDTDTNTTLLLDEKGVFLSQTDKTTLPTIIQKGKSPNLFALKIVAGVKSMYSVSSGEIKNESLVVDMQDGLRVVFPLEGDADVLLGSLRLIYSRVSTGDLVGKYSQVDLRFHNPILR